MAHPKDRKGKGKSVMFSFRLEQDVADKLRRLHPNTSEYLRERITYDTMRSHQKVKR